MNPRRIANLSVLLQDDLISFYWMGFLVADGHFYKNAIKLHLAECDREHIDRFRAFVGYTGKAKTCSLNAMNPTVVGAIRNKFGITNRKTYNPCDLTKITDPKLMFSFIVGMFDGDGNVRRRKGGISAVEMKLHGNWLPQLEHIEHFLYDFLKVTRKKATKLARLKKNGYALLLLTDRQLLARMKKQIMIMSLPVMDRKWNGIDENYVSKNEKGMENQKVVFSLFDAGFTAKEAALKLNRSFYTIKSLRTKWAKSS